MDGSCIECDFTRQRVETGVSALGDGERQVMRQNAAGEKAAKWLAVPQLEGVPSDGDSFVLGDALFTVCPWWDGPVIDCGETGGHCWSHSQRVYNLGVTTSSLEQSVTLGRVLICHFGGTLRDDLGYHRQSYEKQGSDARGNADQRMEEKADDHIKRHPRQIKQCTRSRGSEKASHLVEISHWLQPFIASPRL